MFLFSSKVPTGANEPIIEGVKKDSLTLPYGTMWIRYSLRQLSWLKESHRTVGLMI
jgi:hypothetical protein